MKDYLFLAIISAFGLAAIITVGARALKWLRKRRRRHRHRKKLFDELL